MENIIRVVLDLKGLWAVLVCRQLPFGKYVYGDRNQNARPMAQLASRELLLLGSTILRKRHCNRVRGFTGVPDYAEPKLDCVGGGDLEVGGS